jgi:hypothetical protein
LPPGHESLEGHDFSHTLKRTLKKAGVRAFKPVLETNKVECGVAAEEFRRDYFRCRAAIASSALGELDLR